MLKLFTLFSLAAFAFGQPMCEFVVVMYSNATVNKCFEGWPIKQAANLAGPLVKAWREKEYPVLIQASDTIYAVPILTQAEYDSLDSAAKLVYEQAQKDWGYNVGYDKTYPYWKNSGYKMGWNYEYTNKLNATVLPNATQPMAAPHPVQPSFPSPLPWSVTVAAGHTTWYVASYKKGWDVGKFRGFLIGLKEGKANGKIALERGDDFHYAYTTGYNKGYDDASAGLSALHRRLLNNHRKLRGTERQLGKHFMNGYSNGYEMAQRVLAHTDRRLLTCIHPSCPNATATNQYCQVMKQCSGNQTQQQTTYTLPVDGSSGGADFKDLIAHVIGKKCNVTEVQFEIWKECPITR